MINGWIAPPAFVLATISAFTPMQLLALMPTLGVVYMTLRSLSPMLQRALLKEDTFALAPLLTRPTPSSTAADHSCLLTVMPLAEITW